MNPVKVFFLFSLIVGQSVWGSPTFIGEDILLRGAKTGIVDPPPQPKPEFFFPNCRNLSESPNVSLDILWYVPRQIEIITFPESKNLMKVQIHLGLGACREINYSRFSSTEQKFYPTDAWPLLNEVTIKDPPAYVVKGSTYIDIAENPVESGKVIQDVVTLTLDRELLVKELKEKGPLSVKVDYLLTGLYLGFYFNKFKFIKLTYQFELQDDQKSIRTSIKTRR